MLFDDTYLTLAKPAEATFSDRGSKFIAFAYPITNESDIKPLLTQVKLQHPKANHHCWAMRLTPDRSVFRANDDGEPSGTAGRPILNVLLSKNITNTLVIVVRYFGGKLLGVPGLINAYKTATEQAISSAGVMEKVISDVYTITFDYIQMNAVMKFIKEENIQILNQQADNQYKLQILIKKSKVNQTIEHLNGINNISVQYNHTT